MKEGCGRVSKARDSDISCRHAAWAHFKCIMTFILFSTLRVRSRLSVPGVTCVRDAGLKALDCASMLGCLDSK